MSWWQELEINFDSGISLQDRERYMELDINAALYATQKFIIDALYDACLNFLSFLDEALPNLVEFYIPLPSGAAFRICHKVAGSWVIDDFRLGPRSADVGKLVLYLPFLFIKLVFPKWNLDWGWMDFFANFKLKFKNPILTNKDLYWKNSEQNWVLGSTFDPVRKYRVNNLLVDATAAVIVSAISYALIQAGLGKLEELWKQGLTKSPIVGATSTFQQALKIVDISTKTTTVVTKMEDVLSEGDLDPGETIANIAKGTKTNIDQLQSAVGILAPGSTIASELADLQTTLTALDYLQTLLEDLESEGAGHTASMSEILATLKSIRSAMGLKLAFTH